MCSIWRLFEICGQAPGSDLIEFRKHLDELSQNGAYSALLDNQQPVSLDVNFLVS